MEKKLKKLFDYQKFINNPHLNEVINNVASYEKVDLCDEQLLAVVGGKNEDRKDKDDDIYK